MPELWLHKIFPRFIFLNSNPPEKSYRVFKKKAEIDELPVELALTFFNAICLITIWIGQKKIVRMVNIKILIYFVLQNFCHCII